MSKVACLDPAADNMHQTIYAPTPFSLPWWGPHSKESKTVAARLMLWSTQYFLHSGLSLPHPRTRHIMVSWEKLAIAKILSGIPKSTTLHVIPKIKSKRASFSPCSLFRHYPMKYWGKHTLGPDTPSHVNQKITCGLTLRVRTKLTANHRAPQSTWSDGFNKFTVNTHTGMFAAKVVSSNKFAVTKCFSKRRPTQKPCCPSCR